MKTTAAPMMTPTRVFGLTMVLSEGVLDEGGDRLAGLVLGDGLADRVLVGAEQRGRRQHRGGDRDALGDGLGGVADRVQLGQDLRTGRADVAGHLGDALGVVRDRAEGVHRDDHADRGEQAAAGQRHREQRHRDGRAAEQEGTEHRGGDHQRGVDGGFEADRDAGQDHGGGTGQRGVADVLHGLALGAGEDAGQPQDDRGQHDADQHRDDRDQRRVARVAGQRAAVDVVADAVQLGELGRQEHQRGDRDTARRRCPPRCRSCG